MKRRFTWSLALALALAPAPSVMAALPSPAKPPQPVILDTDMGDDCDDVGALFVLHGAVERGEARLLATMGCVSADAIAPALDAINTWFGHPEIPVGTLKDPGFHLGPHYTAEIARRYPHRFPTGAGYPDATVLYRQVLANQPDGSVVILAIGPLRNLAHLLQSHPDAASPLDGLKLAARKVKRLDVMGGVYPPDGNNHEAEWNFKQDAAAAAFVCSNWPTPVLFNGEGGSTCSGRRVTYEMPEHNPLTMAYWHYPSAGFAGDRLSWDSISGLVTARGAAPWYRVVSNGFNAVDPATGVNTWQTAEHGRHSYLVMQAPKGEIERALEDMQTAGRGRPRGVTFDTAYYARAGMCQITSRAAVDTSTAAINAFDGEDRTVWWDKAPASWVQCQYADGRKYRATSYAVVCPDPLRLPKRLVLSGSNDEGLSWTPLDTEETPGFGAPAPRREFVLARPAKWNAYRLDVTAANGDEGVRVGGIELNEFIDCDARTEVAGLTLDSQSLHLPARGRAALNATLSPLNTGEREVAWESSDPSVAEVRRIGEQVAMVCGKTPGQCSITASLGHVRQSCPVTVTASAVPAGWSYDELNAPPIRGSVLFENGVFRITGCGHSITSWWERVRDQGVYVSQAAKAHPQISARLCTLGPNVGGPSYPGDTRPPSACGLMIRESLADRCARFFLIQVEATGELVCRWRDQAGNQDDNQQEILGKVDLPVYLQLRHNQSRIEAWTSSDGQNWGRPRKSHAAAFGQDSRLGMFVCSGNTFASTTAAFDSVMLSP